MYGCIITGLVCFICYLLVSNKDKNKQYKMLEEEVIYLRQKVFQYEIRETLEIVFSDEKYEDLK